MILLTSFSQLCVGLLVRCMGTVVSSLRSVTIIHHESVRTLIHEQSGTHTKTTPNDEHNSCSSAQLQLSRAILGLLLQMVLTSIMRSFRFSPKHVLLSTCLLLVLVAGVTAQIAAQSTISLDLTVIFLPPDYVLFDASVNGVEYCIVTSPGAGSSLPSASQLKAATTVLEITLNGEVYEGPCPLTLGAGGGGFGVSNYRSTNGGSLGDFTATITIDGSPSGDFTIVIVFTAGDGGLHSESKITGTLSGLGETVCVFENLASQYAFVTGAGFTLNLQLLTHGWGLQY